MWTDALLNIVYSSSLAISIILLSIKGSYQTGIDSLVFGDILAISPTNLWVSGGLLLASMLFVGLTLKTQILLTLNESLAVTRSINVFVHRTVFMMLLSLVIATAIKALVGAFVVFPLVQPVH